MSAHKGKNMTVLAIDHTPYWTEAEKTKNEKFWVHSLKLLKPDGIVKQIQLLNKKESVLA